MSPESISNIILFIVFSILQALGDKLEKEYMCPIYCEVDHKHMMSYVVNGKDCFIYEKEEVPDSLEYKENWHEADEGDWVLTDDNYVIQILKKKGNLIQTCTGTYTSRSKLDTKKKKDITSISGKSSYQKVIDRENPTQKEYFFALRASKGQKPAEAYMEVYDTKNPRTAAKKAAVLLKTKRIKKIMNEDLKDVFEKKGVSLGYLIGAAKDVVDAGKNDSDRLNALKMLWTAFGVIPESTTVTHIAGLIQGFDLEKLEAAKRPKEIVGKSDIST